MEFITLYSEVLNPQDALELSKPTLIEQSSQASRTATLRNFSDALNKEMVITQKIQLCIDPPEELVQILNETSKIQFSFLLSSPYKYYEYLINIEVNQLTCRAKVQLHVLRNGLLWNIKKIGIYQTVLRMILGINGHLTQYSALLDPRQGTFKLMSLLHFKESSFSDLLKFPSNLCTLVLEDTQNMVKILQSHLFHKILLCLNEEPLIQCAQNRYQPQKKTFVDDYTARINKRISFIATVVSNSHAEYPFMNQNQQKPEFGPQIHYYYKIPRSMNKKKVKKDPVTQISYLELEQHRTFYSNNIQRCLRMLANNVADEQSKQIYVQEEDINRIKQWHLNVNLISNSLPPIRTKVINFSLSNERFLERGGFGQIYYYKCHGIRSLGKKGEILSEGKYQDFEIVKKVVADQNKQWYEWKIIKQIGHHSCLYIQKYYDIDDQAKHSIYMDYCSRKSLGLYLIHYKSCTSLELKLLFLYQVTMGLRFLRDVQIVHLDLKPENVLIKIYRMNSNAYPVMRLIDFGQAFRSAQNATPRRGFSFPYSPPELVKEIYWYQYQSQNQEKRTFEYKEKSDVFSLGVMILSMLFQLNMSDIKRMGSKQLLGEGYGKFYYFCAQRCKYFGYEPLMLNLLNLAFKCIRPQKFSRPLLDWICVVLKESLYVLEQI